MNKRETRFKEWEDWICYEAPRWMGNTYLSILERVLPLCWDVRLWWRHSILRKPRPTELQEWERLLQMRRERLARMRELQVPEFLIEDAELMLKVAFVKVAELRGVTTPNTREVSK
jgi:hypothetical protein